MASLWARMSWVKRADSRLAFRTSFFYMEFATVTQANDDYVAARDLNAPGLNPSRHSFNTGSTIVQVRSAYGYGRLCRAATNTTPGNTGQLRVFRRRVCRLWLEPARLLSSRPATYMDNQMTELARELRMQLESELFKAVRAAQVEWIAADEASRSTARHRFMDALQAFNALVYGKSPTQP